MTPEETRQVLHVAARAEAADGTGPLDEATLLEIRMRPDDVRGWVRAEGFGLLIEDQIHLCVDPDQRDSGVGGELLEALLTDVWPRRSLEAWSHADHPAARRLAARHDFEVVRELWVMRRPADQPLPPVELPDGVPLFVDGSASLGMIDLPETGWSAAAGHATSWGGPGSVGVLVVRRGTRWSNPFPGDPEPQDFGGALPDVAGSLAAAAALQATLAERAEVDGRRRRLVDRIREVAAALPDTEVVGDPVERLPHLVTFSCLYLSGEALVRELDRAGFGVASGSACTASTLEPSHVLAAMGALTHGNVRISLGRDVTEQQVEALLAVLPEIVGRLRSEVGL